MKTKRKVKAANPARARKRKLKIFISHSSRDVSLVTLIINLLLTSTLKPDEIRCTSVRGYGLSMSTDIAEALRSDIEECEIIIAVLTKEALDSFNVLLELGAGWGLGKRLIPITGPGVEFNSLPQWLSRKHGMAWNHEECWGDFKPDVFRPLRKQLKNPKRFNGIIQELIKWLPAES